MDTISSPEQSNAIDVDVVSDDIASGEDVGDGVDLIDGALLSDTEGEAIDDL